MWAKAGHFNFFSLVYISLLCPWLLNVSAQNKREVDVGVILDTGSWIGNISWSCMPIALKDFYATYPNYTTRLKLHLRDSGDTAFGAAASALDLLKNVQVQAIIGPQTSAQAKFVSELGNKTHVPIISFSAKSPLLSHKKNPYFIRTGFNDSSQAKVIASVIKKFNWKNVVPIYEDTVYGNGILPYLVDALQEVEANVPYRSSLPLSSTDDQIMSELSKLKNMSTRVFVVHTTYILGHKLFSNANKAGMMEEGYVWITTYGLTDIVDLMGPQESNVMQGVLGIKPFVRDTNKLNEFKLRWRKEYNKSNPDSKISEPSVFGLWAYDTVWAVALAAEHAVATNPAFEEVNNTANSSTDFSRLKLSLHGSSILNQILSTKFKNGMSGKFELIDGQLPSKDFEIVNFMKHGKMTCGMSGGDEFIKNTNIIWPGGKKVAPKGWEWPIKGTQLQIGIPVKPGFDMFVRYENGTAKGYCIDVFEAAMKKLPYNVSYKFLPFQNKSGGMNGTYDDLVYQVYLKKFDAVVGDVTIISNRSLYVDFTLPFIESGVSMVVPVRDERKKGAWTFLKPLTTDLWLGSGSFFIFTGLVVWFLEHRVNEEFRGTTSNQLGTIFYFAFSTLVFAHREKVVSNLARVVVVIWLFVVLVLQSSYTASLTSMLTVEQLQPTVTDINELLKNGATVGYLDDSFMPALLKRLKFDQSKTKPYQSPEDYNEAMSNGTIAAIFDEVPYLKVFLSRYCKKYVMTGPTYKTDGFGFVFPKGSPLVPDISRAILQIKESDDMTYFENELYKNGTCSDQDGISETSSSLTVRSFWGLFLITGIASFSALIIYLIHFLYENRDLLTSHDSENSVRKRIGSLVKAYDQLDPARAPKKPEVVEMPIINDIMVTPFSISGPQSPASVSNLGEERFFEIEEVSTDENEDEDEDVDEDDVDEDEDEDEIPGREIKNQIGEPSFKDMIVERSSNGLS